MARERTNVRKARRGGGNVALHSTTSHRAADRAPGRGQRADRPASTSYVLARHPPASTSYVLPRHPPASTFYVLARHPPAFRAAKASEQIPQSEAPEDNHLAPHQTSSHDLASHHTTKHHMTPHHLAPHYCTTPLRTRPHNII